MDSTTSISERPFKGFSAEFWLKIIPNIKSEDLAEAWFTLRRVSKTLSDITEEVSQDLIKNTNTIECDLGQIRQDDIPFLELLEGPKTVEQTLSDISLYMSFTHFDEDDCRVHFAHPDEDFEKGYARYDAGLHYAPLYFVDNVYYRAFIKLLGRDRLLQLWKIGWHALS